MWLLSLISFLLLGGYLVLCGMRFGIPDMVSDTYYQLQGCTGSEARPFKKPRNLGWLFSVVMCVVAFLMMICLLDLGKGIQPLAFWGCGGLMLVGLAPCYLSEDERRAHKAGAIVAAIGCVGWCMSVCWWVTLIVGAAYLLYLVAIDIFKVANSFWYISGKTRFHPWYWLEVSAFADVFLTYWIMAII